METMMGYIEESAAQCRRNIEQASQLVQPAVDLYTKKEYNRILIIASGCFLQRLLSGEILCRKGPQGQNGSRHIVYL